MPKSSVAFILLSFSNSTERAYEIEGDLLEEARSKGRLWFFLQIIQAFLALNISAFKKAPWSIIVLSIVSLLSMSALSIFLLFPFVFQIKELSFLMMLLVTCTFRAIACFVIGVAIVGFSSKLGKQAIVIAVVIMSLNLLLKFTFYSQQWVFFWDVFLGSNFQGGVPTILFYGFASIVPILSGGIYSHRFSETSLGLSGYGRIASPLNE